MVMDNLVAKINLIKEMMAGNRVNIGDEVFYNYTGDFPVCPDCGVQMEKIVIFRLKGSEKTITILTHADMIDIKDKVISIEVVWKCNCESI
jgi:hypothetical protein